MVYSKIVSCYDTPINLAGRTIQAFYSEYSLAALRLDDNEVMSFAVEEVPVGKWFEVFPICKGAPDRDYPFTWSELEFPFTVTSSDLLWREEWVAPASDASTFMGSGPHFVQYAAVLGSAPESNANVVKVLAGIRLTAQNGAVLVISSSENTPFKISLATEGLEIEHVMQFHTAARI
jgi:hypothetical protein